MTRLAGSLIGFSFIVASALALVLPRIAGAAGLLAAVCAVLAAGTLAALVVASGKAVRLLSGAALGAAACGLPLLAVAAGGAASPPALLLAALVIEPLWAERGRGGLLASGAAVIAGALSMTAAVLLVDAGPVHGWYWLPVIAYLLGVAARMNFSPAAPIPAAPEIDLLAASGIVALRLSDNGDVANVHGGARPVFGVADDMLLGSGFLDRILVGDRVAYLCALQDAKAGSGATGTQIRVRVAGQSAADAPAYRLFDIRFLVSETDVLFATARASVEAERLKGELEQAEHRCEAIGVARNRMLASVSHELRTPLNAIIGFSDMLLMGLFGSLRDERQREYITLVRDSGDHLLGVVNSILDVSKIESGAYSITPEAFPLTEVLAMTSSMMAGHAQAKNVSVHTEVEQSALELVADRRAVQQMMINLVSNAIKFTPNGGAVTIRAAASHGWLRLSVTDTGIGMAANDLQRIGEPFTQIQNDYTRQSDGAGLGLSLVKGLAALHDGTVEITSAPGVGTCVTIMLPLDGPKAGGEAGARLIPFGAKSTREGTDGGFRKTA